MRALPNRLLLSVLAIVATSILLAGCGDSARRAMGFGKNPPDEFRVVKRAPLSMPPDFQLRPPAPGAERPQEEAPREKAEQAIFTRNGSGSESDRVLPEAQGLSEGERSLLARAGADEARDDIRRIVDRETQQLVEESRSFVDTLVFWREPQGPEKVVDAGAEARRLRENAAIGESPTKGQTPTIERRRRGILEDLF